MNKEEAVKTIDEIYEIISSCLTKIEKIVKEDKKRKI